MAHFYGYDGHRYDYDPGDELRGCQAAVEKWLRRFPQYNERVYVPEQIHNIIRAHFPKNERYLPVPLIIYEGLMIAFLEKIGKPITVVKTPAHFGSW
jgi:hypothetical protein